MPKGLYKENERETMRYRHLFLVGFQTDYDTNSGILRICLSKEGKSFCLVRVSYN